MSSKFLPKKYVLRPYLLYEGKFKSVLACVTPKTIIDSVDKLADILVSWVLEVKFPIITRHERSIFLRNTRGGMSSNGLLR